jgi:myo-inositol-1(or 4)-monophosphatase
VDVVADLDLARRAAAAGAKCVLTDFRRPAKALRAKSSPSDLVSATDLASENAIRTLIRRERPNDSILGEESGLEQYEGKRMWLIDPLDGTLNFIFGIYGWAISVASRDEAGFRAGVIFDPLLAEEWSAARGHGVFLNGNPAHLERRNVCSLPEARIVANLLFRECPPQRAARLRQAVLECAGAVASPGGALAYVWAANGRVDLAYVESTRTGPWDTAAAEAIAREAGLEAFWVPSNRAANDALPAFVVGRRPLTDLWLDRIGKPFVGDGAA